MSTSRESAEAKGRYLTEGCLEVELVDGWRVIASCRGNGDVYQLGYDPNARAWRCTCAARGRCCALQLVTCRPDGTA